MTLTQQLEDKKKELEQDKALGIGNRIYRLKAEIAILEQAIAEIKNIQSQQKTFKTSQNDRQGNVQTLVSGDEEVGVNSQFLRDNADTPQRASSLPSSFSDSPVVSNLLQKQRQEDFKKLVSKLKSCDEFFNVRGYEDTISTDKFMGIVQLFIHQIEQEQLNQPKTEGCGRMFNDFIFGERICGRFEDLKHSDHIILCLDCKKENSK